MCREQPSTRRANPCASNGLKIWAQFYVEQSRESLNPLEVLLDTSLWLEPRSFEVIQGLFLAHGSNAHKTRRNEPALRKKVLLYHPASHFPSLPNKKRRKGGTEEKQPKKKTPSCKSRRVETCSDERAPSACPSGNKKRESGPIARSDPKKSKSKAAPIEEGQKRRPERERA